MTDGTVTDYNLLFQWADAALYQVKSKGKGAYYLLDVKEGVALPGKSYLDNEENKEDEIVHKEAQFDSAEDLVLFCRMISDHFVGVLKEDTVDTVKLDKQFIDDTMNS